MTIPAVPTRRSRAQVGGAAPGLRPARPALRRLGRPRWRRQLATALVFAGGVVAGAGGTALLPASAHSAGRPVGDRTGSSTYGLPIAPVGLAGPKPGAPAVAQTRAPSAPPLEVVVPAIGVRSRLLGLRLNLDGTVQVPDDYGVAGWYRDGPAPGDPGAALILGHVDSTSGPGIFFRLHELRKGDPVLVRRADGTTARFVVERSATFPKSRFPAAKVYAATARPELRLVTCSGDFAAGHYLDNLVVFARLAVPAPATRPIAKRPVARTPVGKPVGPPVRKPVAEPVGRPVAKPAPAAARLPVRAPVSTPLARFTVREPRR